MDLSKAHFVLNSRMNFSNRTSTLFPCGALMTQVQFIRPKYSSPCIRGLSSLGCVIIPPHPVNYNGFLIFSPFLSVIVLLKVSNVICFGKTYIIIFSNNYIL